MFPHLCYALLQGQCFTFACVVCISSDNVAKSHRGCCLGGIIINHGFYIFLFIENSTIIDIEQFWTKS
jgi:hypothetical protein